LGYDHRIRQIESVLVGARRVEDGIDMEEMAMEAKAGKSTGTAWKEDHERDKDGSFTEFATTRTVIEIDLGE
jgi:hypothetical protein